jgi:hypothetical protein
MKNQKKIGNKITNKQQKTWKSTRTLEQKKGEKEKEKI